MFKTIVSGVGKITRKTTSRAVDTAGDVATSVGKTSSKAATGVADIVTTAATGEKTKQKDKKKKSKKLIHTSPFSAKFYGQLIKTIRSVSFIYWLNSAVLYSIFVQIDIFLKERNKYDDFSGGIGNVWTAMKNASAWVGGIFGGGYAIFVYIFPLVLTAIISESVWNNLQKYNPFMKRVLYFEFVMCLIFTVILLLYKFTIFDKIVTLFQTYIIANGVCEVAPSIPYIC